MTKWFMGTGLFAAECLKSVVKTGMIPDLAVTLPPSPSGRRGSSLYPTPFEVAATNLNIKIHRSPNVNKDPLLLGLMESNPPEVIFVVDFGQKIGIPFLDVPSLGCLNVHPSLLPFYRGAAPVQRAIMDGKKETGVTVFRLVDEMDAGPIILSESVTIDPDENSGELLFRLAYIGGILLSRGVNLLLDGETLPRLQNSELSTYASKIDKVEALIQWDSPGESIHNRVRALNPQPGAYAIWGDQRLKIWRTQLVSLNSRMPCGSIFIGGDGYPLVQCLPGSIKLLEVQPQGKKKIDGGDWLRGSHLSEGDRLS